MPATPAFQGKLKNTVQGIAAKSQFLVGAPPPERRCAKDEHTDALILGRRHGTVILN
jgi:hypothetical protein